MKLRGIFPAIAMGALGFAGVSPAGTSTVSAPMVFYTLDLNPMDRQELIRQLPGNARVITTDINVAVAPKDKFLTGPMEGMPSIEETGDMQWQFRVGVVVSADGNVQAGYLLTLNDPRVIAPMLKAIKTWKFVPGTVGGKKVPFFRIVEFEVTRQSMLEREVNASIAEMQKLIKNQNR